MHRTPCTKLRFSYRLYLFLKRAGIAGKYLGFPSFDILLGFQKMNIQAGFKVTNMKNHL